MQKIKRPPPPEEEELQNGCCPKLAPCPRSGARWVLGASMSVRTFSLSLGPFFSIFLMPFFLLLRYLGGGKQVRGLEEKVGCGIFSPGGKISAVFPRARGGTKAKTNPARQMLVVEQHRQHLFVISFIL